MNRTVAAFLLGALAGLPAGGDDLAPPDPPQPDSPPPVAELLVGSAAARGPADAWAALRSFRVTGAYNRNGRESRLVLVRERPDRFRLEIRFPGRDQTDVGIGDRVWRLEEGRETRELDPAAAESVRALIDVFAAWPDFWDRFDAVTAAGRETLTTGPAWRMEVTAPAGPGQNWYLDAETLLPVASLQQVTLPDGGIEEFSTWSFEWDEVEAGLLFPRYTELDYGTALFSLSVEEIELDPELDGRTFVLEGMPADPTGR